MERHELTDEQWALIEDLFPRNGVRCGPPWNDHRRLVDGILWILKTGAPWRDLPEKFGPWETVYHRFSRYVREETLDRIVERLQIKLDEEGMIDEDLFCIDGTNVRAHRCAAGAKKRVRRKQAWMSPKTTR